MIATILVAASVLGQHTVPTTTPLTPQERAALQRKLGDLQKVVDGVRTAAVGEVYTRFKQTLAGGRSDLLLLYLDCIEDIDFKRKGKSTDDFKEWIKKNKTWIESDAHVTALRLQLGYLVLRMDASTVRTPEQLQALLDGLFRHIEAVAAADEILGNQKRMLRGDVMNSSFADAYGIRRFVRIDPKYEWVEAPGDIFKIFDKTLMPIARRRNDPVYMSTLWASRIRIETERAAREMENNPHAKVRFNSFTLPSLRWNRARDLHAAGDERGAVTEMVTILGVSTNHPDASIWIRELEGLLGDGE